MAKPGRKPQSAEILNMRGTNSPYRSRESVFDEVQGEPERPEWLTGAALEIWTKKLQKYEARGQNVVGLEDSLAQYCSLEAAMVRKWAEEDTPPISWLNTYRVFAGEFFDTPASQMAPSGKTAKSNPFSKNGTKNKTLP